MSFIKYNESIDLISIFFFSLGGKWTTYRSMAKDTMDAAVETCGLEPRNDSLTDGLILEGGHGWGPASFIRLVQDFGLENEVCINKNEI